MKEYISFYQNIFNYSGRATRKEYWISALFNTLILIVVYVTIILNIVAMEYDDIYSTSLIATCLISGVLYLVIMLGGISVMVRRLHDIGKSGWYYFLAFIPLVGGIILFVFSCTKSGPMNQWGPNKYCPEYMQGIGQWQGGSAVLQNGMRNQPVAGNGMMNQPVAGNGMVNPSVVGVRNEAINQAETEVKQVANFTQETVENNKNKILEKQEIEENKSSNLRREEDEEEKSNDLGSITLNI